MSISLVSLLSAHSWTNNHLYSSIQIVGTDGRLTDGSIVMTLGSGSTDTVGHSSDRLCVLNCNTLSALDLPILPTFWVIILSNVPKASRKSSNDNELPGPWLIWKSRDKWISQLILSYLFGMIIWTVSICDVRERNYVFQVGGIVKGGNVWQFLRPVQT